MAKQIVNTYRLDITQLAPERQLHLAIEFLPMRSEPPTAIAVLRPDRTIVGYLDVNDVRSTLTRWDEMEGSYLASLTRYDL